MKVYKGASASPGLVLGQVSRLERHVETFSDGPFNPEREQRMLDEAIHTAQTELDSMAERSAPTEQAIFLFQSMMLEDEGMMNEVRFQIKAGVGAAEAMDRVGRRYAERLANMKDNAYVLEGKVIMKGQDISMFCDKLYLLSKENDLERIDARGRVQLISGGTVAKSEKAVYHFKDDKVVLTERPKILKDNVEMDGESIIYDLSSGIFFINMPKMRMEK